MDPYAEASDGEDAEAQAMAAAMGFSSFGSHKPTAKKRKFNPMTDAYTDGDELAGLDKGGKKGQGSGGNTAPLGKLRVFGAGSAATGAGQEPVEGRNRDEIDLDDDEEGSGDGPRYMDTSLPPPIEGEGPSYVDTSQPPPISDEEAREMQSRIDAILSGIEAQEPGDTLPPNPTSGTQPLPPKPPSRPFSDASLAIGGPRPGARSREGFDDASSVASSSRPSERGQRNARWYVGYYDPSFNANPWAALEKAQGLGSLGTWLENRGGR